jgi:hypothetical protein
MKIKITSVLSPELSSHFLCFTSELQNFLSQELESFDVGIGVDVFMAVFVAVDDDPVVNEKFARQHDKSTRFKGLDGNWVRDIEVAIELRPADVHNVLGSKSKFEKLLLDALAARLELPIKRSPKDFRLDEFLKRMGNALTKF